MAVDGCRIRADAILWACRPPGQNLGLPPKLASRSRSWASAHTDFGQGQVQHLGLPPKLASRSRPWASAHTDQRPGNARASGLRAFLTACSARWLCFRCRSDSRKIPPLRGALRSGYNPRKKTRGFPPLLRRYFGTGLNVNFTTSPSSFKKACGRFRKLAE